MSTVAALVALAPCVAAPARMLWGQESHQLRLAIAAAAAPVSSGSPENVTVILENLGSDLDIYPPCVDFKWFSFDIKDPGGNTVPELPSQGWVCSWSPTSIHFAHGDILVFKLDLGQRYRFAKAGAYSVTAHSDVHLPGVMREVKRAGGSATPFPFFPIYASLTSNSITVDVTASN